MGDATAIRPLGKTCTQCQIWLSLSRFHVNAQASDGLQASCKECRKNNRRLGARRDSVSSPALFGKSCGNCQIWYPLDSFHAARGKQDGRTSTCKDCSLSASRRRYARAAQGQKDAPSTDGKTCTRCQTRKPTEGFHRKVGASDGLHSHCKECHKELNRIRYAALPDVSPAEPGEGKACTRCGSWRPLDEFYPDKGKRDGRHSICKQCESERSRERWEGIKQDPERLAAEKARSRAYFEANRDKYRESAREWRKNNPEKWCAIITAWNRANPERAREIARRSYQLTYRADSGPMLEKNARRRALKKAANVGVVNYTVLLELHGLGCYLCGGEISPDDLHMDHVVPLSRGGAHSMENIRPSHAACNLRKSDKLVSELSWTVAA